MLIGHFPSGCFLSPSFSRGLYILSCLTILG